MNISQLTDILLNIKTSIDANLNMDYQSHLKRLEEIGLTVSLQKEVANLYKPIIKNAEWDRKIKNILAEMADEVNSNIKKESK